MLQSYVMKLSMVRLGWTAARRSFCRGWAMKQSDTPTGIDSTTAGSTAAKGLSFELSAEQTEIQQLARKLTHELVLPVVAHHDRTGEYPMEIFNKFWKAGLMNLHIPKKYGGTESGHVAECVLIGEVAFACSGFSLILSSNSFAQAPVVFFGNDAQKKKYLGRMTEEPLHCAFAGTEPGAGSDVAGYQTRAAPKGDHYVLNGQKMWITNAGVANWFFVVARTAHDPKTPAHQSMSAFIVDADSPGVTVGRKEWNMGQRASDTRGITFEDVLVPKENMVGKEGAGFKIAMDVFNRSRSEVSMGAVGIARRALYEASRYAMERKAFGVPIIQHGAVAAMLADMAINYELSRACVLRAAWEFDEGRTFPYFASIAKAFAADMAFKSAADCVQIMGGNGYNSEYPAEKLMRDAKIYQIYEGTSQVQRVIIAREIVRRMKEGLL